MQRSGLHVIVEVGCFGVCVRVCITAAARNKVVPPEKATRHILNLILRVIYGLTVLNSLILIGIIFSAHEKHVL